MSLPLYIKRRGDTLLYSGKGLLKMYIPEKQFDLNIVTIKGDFYSYLGIVDYAVSDIDGKNIGSLHQMKCPTRLECKPSFVEKLKDIKLTKTSKPQDYRVLNFKDGSPIILCTKVPKIINNVEELTNLFFITGNIPNTISYDEIQFYIEKNMRLNGNSYNINLQEWGIIISEICRSSKDTSVPFRLSGSKDFHDYQSISVKDLSKTDSAFSAIQSENFDDSVVHAMMAKKESTSPLEKILTNGF